MSRNRDAVARIVATWGEERPDLDASPMLVVGRLQRVAQLLDAGLRPPFAAAGLGQGDFDILAALRRAGRPFAHSPGELRDALLVTSGAITKQVDRLVAKGLVTREVDPSDGRGRRVTLTDDGYALVDELIGTHLDNERRLLSPLTSGQQRQLASLLSILAEALEGDR
jgi:DNA-binding MarR family transcriptional regulator